MLTLLTDIAPKAVVTAGLGWAIVNYFVIGPEIASRVVRTDHLPICESDFKNVVAKAADERAKALPLPSLDPAHEFALNQIRQFKNNPMMNELRRMSGGMGDLFGIDQAANFALDQYEAGKEAAKRAYDLARERIEAETVTELGKSGDVCGCLADAAISETRTEWAIFSGTLSLIRPAPLEAFDQRMSEVRNTGRCLAAKAGS